MEFKIHKNQVIGTLCYDYYNMVEHLSKYTNAEQIMNLLAKENGLNCLYYYDFNNNLFFIKLYGSITNMLRFRSSIKYLFGFKEKND